MKFEAKPNHEDTMAVCVNLQITYQIPCKLAITQAVHSQQTQTQSTVYPS